jgi:hypothetical protein
MYAQKGSLAIDGKAMYLGGRKQAPDLKTSALGHWLDQKPTAVDSTDSTWINKKI